jgi:hypothetical protein
MGGVTMAVLTRRNLWCFVFLLLLCLAWPSWSLAQGEGGQASPAISSQPQKQAAQEEVTGPPTTGPILTSGALPMGKGNFAIQPYTYVSFLGGEFSPTWKPRGVGKDQITLGNAISLYYGITENFWVSTFWSYYIHNWVYNIRNPEPGQGRSAQDGNYGPLSLTFRYRFFAQQGRWPTVTGLFTLGLPSNRGTRVDVGTLPAQVSGARNWGFTWGVNLHRYARPLILYLNLWYFMATIDKREKAVDGVIALEKFNPWDQVKFNLAAEIPLRWEGGPWVVLLELNSFWEVGPIFGPGPDTKAAAKVTGLVGLEYIFNPEWRLALGFAFNILGKNSSINYTPVITLYKPLNLFKRKNRH